MLLLIRAPRPDVFHSDSITTYLLNRLAGRLAANMLMDRAEHVDPHRGEKAAADPVSILMSRALSCSVYVERIVHLDLDFQEVGNPIDGLP